MCRPTVRKHVANRVERSVRLRQRLRTQEQSAPNCDVAGTGTTLCFAAAPLAPNRLSIRSGIEQEGEVNGIMPQNMSLRAILVTFKSKHRAFLRETLRVWAYFSPGYRLAVARRVFLPSRPATCSHWGERGQVDPGLSDWFQRETHQPVDQRRGFVWFHTLWPCFQRKLE